MVVPRRVVNLVNVQRRLYFTFGSSEFFSVFFEGFLLEKLLFLNGLRFLNVHGLRLSLGVQRLEGAIFSHFDVFF